MTVISIRRAKEKDAAVIAKLASDLGYAADADAMRSRIKSVLRSSADFLIVAVENDSVIGWLQAHAAHIIESGFRVEITGLVVSPAVRRRGVGRALVTKAEDWARIISAAAVVVRSNVQRAESHVFYSALDYTFTKTQKVYRKALGPGS